MKLLKLLLSATVAMGVLATLMVALSLGHPADVKAEEQPNGPAAPAAPLTLPPPYLSDDDVADAPYSAPNIWPPPAVDGLIAPGEYAHAGKVTFPGYGGDVEVFLREDAAYLYIAFDLPSLPPGSFGFADVYLDAGNDGGLDGNDYWLHIDSMVGIMVEQTGAGGAWSWAFPIGWTAASTTTLAGGGWQAEFAIRYDKLGLTAGTFQELGLALGTENGGLFLWPSGADRDDPSYDPRCLKHPLCNITTADWELVSVVGDGWLTVPGEIWYQTRNGNSATRCSNTREIFVDDAVHTDGNATAWHITYLNWYFSENVEEDPESLSDTIITLTEPARGRTTVPPTAPLENQ